MEGCNSISTLLLDKAFLPFRFLTKKVAFRHLCKNSVKIFDAEENVLENADLWFSGQGKKYPDQPSIKSISKTWYIPTVLAIKADFIYNRNVIPKSINHTQLCKIYKNTCQICLKKFPKELLTLEHIFPKSKGGTSGIENITLTCFSCNQSKKDIYPYLNKKSEPLSTVNLPLPISTPNQDISIRPEWQKFFIYK